MPATFHLSDGRRITGATTYGKVSSAEVVNRVGLGPIYSVFHDGSHDYVPVAEVVSIVRSDDGNRGVAWYDLPVAASMWRADADDLNA